MTASDAGYDDLLEAVAAGEAYYLACPNGHGMLPPRRTCPDCGALELTEEPLPESGTVETFTVVHVAAPRFADDTPYVTAIADFGPVRVTGVVRGDDPSAVEAGTTVELDVGETATRGDPVLVLRPR